MRTSVAVSTWDSGVVPTQAAVSTWANSNANTNADSSSKPASNPIPLEDGYNAYSGTNPFDDAAPVAADTATPPPAPPPAPPADAAGPTDLLGPQERPPPPPTVGGSSNVRYLEECWLSQRVESTRWERWREPLVWRQPIQRTHPPYPILQAADTGSSTQAAEEDWFNPSEEPEFDEVNWDKEEVY